MPDDPPSNHFRDLPDQDRDPVVWDPAQRKFVPAGSAPAAASEPRRDPRRFYVGAPAEGQSAAPPPRAAPDAPAAPAAPPPPSAPPVAPPRPSPSPSPAPIPRTAP